MREISKKYALDVPNITMFVHLVNLDVDQWACLV